MLYFKISLLVQHLLGFIYFCISNLSILVPPQISPFEFGEEAINAGEVTMLNCFVMKGDFPLRIHWTLNGKPLDHFIGISFSNNKRSSQLNIESVSSEHAGEYTCHASNSAGNSSYSAMLNVNGIFRLKLHRNVDIVFYSIGVAI